MNFLFLSDTHGDLKSLISEIDLSSVDLIILLGDNTKEDLINLKSIYIPKIGIIGNHRFRLDDGNISKLEDFGIEDISFKRFEFGGFSFYGIDGSVSYQIFEDRKEKDNKKIANPNIKNEIEDFDIKIKDFFNQTNLDFLISHFPARGIMDGDSFSSKGLNIIKDYIEVNNPRYFLHGHLHYSGKEILGNTKIIQVYKHLNLYI